ncbi:MAG TPA: response regulator [Bacteroidales bacterium]|nr:response regulator [Bacteroidales bacterium]
MKRIFIIVYSAFVIIMLTNYFYYKNLYSKQIDYIFELLARQVQIVGLEVDETNNSFLSDLNQINFSEDLTSFFTKPENYRRAIDRMKLFFTKYEAFVTSIKYYDDKKNEFTLKRDTESESGDWLEQSFVLHVQPEIYDMENLIQESKRYNYYLPVYDENNNTIGNVVVTVDFQKYFREIFTTYNLQDYQWQWVVSDSGEIIYDNYGKKIQYSDLDKIVARLAEGSVENTVHSAIIDTKKTEIVSSYYSTQLLQRDLGLVFSAPTDYFQKYIVRNSLFIVMVTLLLVQVIIYIFWKYIRSVKHEKKKLKASEKMLTKFFNEMPVGVVIYNKERKIIMTNKAASSYYSFNDESEMLGQIFPASSFPDSVSGMNIENEFNSDQFIVLKQPDREIVLFRKSIPVVYKDTEATMEILMDVTILESARKLEAKKNDAKSEFLARMSYEIRTPLNGIVSMAEILGKQDLPSETVEIVRLLRRSSEVLLNIVDNILDFSRIESGNLVIDEIPFNIRDEVSYCIDLARTNTSGKVDISANLSQNIPDIVIGDPVRLRQVLTNLISHSVKNTLSGTIKLSCTAKIRNENSIGLCFEIADTGTSFDELTLKKKFAMNPDIQEFQNDDPAFGTVLARHLVELMGGEFVAESPSGLSGDSGLKVCFTIVAFSAQKVQKNLDNNRHLAYESIKTLVIAGPNRDEDTISILHQLGLNVTVTTYMKLTVNQIKANLNNPAEKYDLLIICDDKNFNGFEAAEALYKSDLSRQVIIMMISSNDIKGNYLKCLNLGVDHYLIKPFDNNELAAKIREDFPFAGETSEQIFVKDGRNLKILFVEDNKMNQIAIGTILRNLGYEFDVAEDGYSAYLKARSKKYDLILMDLFLPEIDGFEAAQKILKSDSSPVIVALTADSMPETRKKAELAGIRDFLTKPVKPDEIKKMIFRHFK